jgi:homeobox protein ESX1
MSQEKRPPAAIVQRYDPRQSTAAAPQAASEPAQAETPSGASPATSKPATAQPPAAQATTPVEIGGPSGPEPTRYGDWERNGRVSDF